MRTPIADFVREYAEKGAVRLHMPGHKGRGALGCEVFDITEVAGADALYEADGIIMQSEENASSLFGSARTVFSTEGSSQCIRAMLYLALTNRKNGASATVVAARNVHKAFVYAAALLDLDVVWLYPEKGTQSLCSCPVTAESLERTLLSLDSPPAAVYITSPDYLGGTADIAALADVCHRYKTVLAVDNAHGAYLKFLPDENHPLQLGADICCDSAHKTLPVLTGGAYLHIGKNAPSGFSENAKSAMALFGSTSPSYLTLVSLDLCNERLSDTLPRDIARCAASLKNLRETLAENGWQIMRSDPLRLTLRAPRGMTGSTLADKLRSANIECEYADKEFLVLMATPDNTRSELNAVAAALGINELPAAENTAIPAVTAKRVISVREAVFSRHETVSVDDALGRVCASPTVACPPAIPIVISGELIDEAAALLFRLCGIDKIDVVV